MHGTNLVVRKMAQSSVARAAIIIATALLSPGCVVAPGQGIADFARDSEGNLYQPDTPRNWKLWVEMIDWHVGEELTGKPYADGTRTWNEYWVGLIVANTNGVREDPARYVSYVIERRAAAGLSPIQGLPDSVSELIGKE